MKIIEDSGKLACSLVELRQFYKDNHVVEFTISIPSMKVFAIKTGLEQQIFINRLFKISLNAVVKNFLTEYYTIFEMNKAGNQHAHGIILINQDVHLNDVYVFMGDLYKSMYRTLTKIKQFKNVKFINDSWYPEFRRVKTPLLTLQYSEQDRCDLWYNYLTKTNN